MDALVRWRTFVGGVRHKVSIGLMVMAVGIVGIFLLKAGVGRGVASFMVGMGAGIALLGSGER